MAEFEWHGDRVLADARAASKRAADAAAHRLHGLSVPRAPVDDGILRGSAKVTPARAVDNAPAASVSYDTPYAVRQHEELGYNHPQGGEAKYLERPLIESQNELLDIVAAELRRGLNG